MNIPVKLSNRLKNFYSEESYALIMKGLETERIGSFRINTLNAKKEEVLLEFQEKNIEISEYNNFSSEISGKYDVYTFDRKFEYAIKGTESFYKGKIYLQSLASMIPVFALDPKEGQNILDVCAAPGSKTTQIATVTNNKSSITALEKNVIRYQRLNHNIVTQGASSSIVTHKTDALKFLKNQTSIRSSCDFDMILLDAPCSAEGRISLSKEKTYGFWTMQNITDKAKLQYELLSSSVLKLQSGGSILYSTCTLAPEENEGVIFNILKNFPEISLEIIPKIFKEPSLYVEQGLSVYDTEECNVSKNTLKILPSQETEGFFIAKLKKK